MNLGDIRTRVKRQFGDTSGAQIQDEDIDRWANDAQVDIVRKTDVLQEIENISVSAGIDQYDLPEDFLRVRRVTYKGSLLRAITLEELDKLAGDRAVTNPTGSPVNYIAWGAKILLFPAPDVTEASVLALWYTRLPADLTGAASVPEVPLQMHEDIVRYCLARAYELNDDIENMQRVMNDYENRVSIERDEAHWPYKDSYPSIRAVAGDDW